MPNDEPTTETMDYQELMLKMQADMAELSGEDLAELAGVMGIEVKYVGDSIFEVPSKSADKLVMLNQTVKNGLIQ